MEVINLPNRIFSGLLNLKRKQLSEEDKSSDEETKQAKAINLMIDEIEDEIDGGV